jgi:hypothetical protein
MALVDSEFDETAMRQRWWINPTDAHSLRLTLQGLQFVKSHLELQSYEFALPRPLNNGQLLQLERVFGGMYYLLKRHKIIVFDEPEAIMLTMYAGDLAAYLDSLATSSNLTTE